MKKLQLEKLTKRYPKTGLVVDGVSAHINNGDFVTLIGPNGCGKSTILKMVAGIIAPDSGKIDAPKNTSYVPQKSSLLPWRTVTENLLLESELGKSVTKTDALTALQHYKLSDFADMYPGQLSGGMQQKVSIIRGVLSRPDLLILDEPFAALDSITRRTMQRWLRELLDDCGMTVLCVTHDISEAVELSDAVVVLSNRPARIVSKHNVTNKNRLSLSGALEKELLHEVV